MDSEKDPMAAGPMPDEISARMCVWRVFGVSREYSDRPDDARTWRSTTPATIDADIEASVTYGDVPSVIIEAIRAGSAHADYLLNNMFGNAYAGMSIEQRREVLAEYEAAVSVDDFKNYPTFVTLGVRRPVTLHGHPTERFLWGSDNHPTAEDFDAFEREAAPALNALLAWILPTFGTQIQLGSIVFGGQVRAYLVAEGKAPLSSPRLEMRANFGFVASGGWATLPFGALDAKLATFAANAQAVGRLLVGASRW